MRTDCFNGLLLLAVVCCFGCREEPVPEDSTGERSIPGKVQSGKVQSGIASGGRVGASAPAALVEQTVPVVAFTAVSPIRSGRLRIGMNGSLNDHELNERVAEHLSALGVVPLRLAPKGAVRLESLDGLVLLGGNDIDPARYGQSPDPSVKKLLRAREEFDFSLVESALRAKLPLLGICLGGQQIWVQVGGKLVQDIPTAVGTTVDHRAKQRGHSVTLLPDTLLHRIYQGQIISVFSNHHQATVGIASGFLISAKAEDGVIEAFESADPEHFVLGLGWHPEHSVGGERVFQALVDAARTFRH